MNKFEPLDISCGQNEVILLSNAMFGRMHLGRCVTAELGYMGCGDNVMHVVDPWCSGKQRCHVETRYPDLLAASTCSDEYIHFLEVEHTCIQGRIRWLHCV